MTIWICNNCGSPVNTELRRGGMPLGNLREFPSVCSNPDCKNSQVSRQTLGWATAEVD
jgi:hypothetical protein